MASPGRWNAAGQIVRVRDQVCLPVVDQMVSSQSSPHWRSIVLGRILTTQTGPCSSARFGTSSGPGVRTDVQMGAAVVLLFIHPNEHGVGSNIDDLAR